MKSIKMKYLLGTVAITAFLAAFSCEQKHFEPALTVAPGGGTLTTFKAYTVDSIPGLSDIYGRIVFWEGNASNTLVQLSLYNTEEGVEYSSGLFDGELAEGSATELISLYTVDGAKGEFSFHKYFVIDEDDFFSHLTTLDAHVSVFSPNMTIISSGNVGLNASPVLQSN